MPIQIKMNTNLSNRVRTASQPTLNSKSLSSLGSSVGRFQNSMIGVVHFSKPGCSSCGH